MAKIACIPAMFSFLCFVGGCLLLAGLTMQGDDTRLADVQECSDMIVYDAIYTGLEPGDTRFLECGGSADNPICQNFACNVYMDVLIDGVWYDDVSYSMTTCCHDPILNRTNIVEDCSVYMFNSTIRNTFDCFFPTPFAEGDMVYHTVDGAERATEWYDTAEDLITAGVFVGLSGALCCFCKYHDRLFGADDDDDI